MAGGPLLPSSIYVGGGGGNLTVGFYIPGVNTNAAGAIEGIGVVGGLTANAPAVLQFNLPAIGAIPTGTFKLRTLAWANATTGNAIVNIQDCQTAVAANIGATTLTQEGAAPTINPLAWAAAQNDIIREVKTNLSLTPTAGNIYTVLVTFTTASWTLAQASVWQFSLVWE